MKDEDMDEARIDEIAKFYAAQYWNEEQAGKFPNLGLIIRDALIEYRRRAP